MILLSKILNSTTVFKNNLSISSRDEEAPILWPKDSIAGKLTYFLVYSKTWIQGEETCIRMFVEILFVIEKKNYKNVHQQKYF